MSVADLSRLKHGVSKKVKLLDAELAAAVTASAGSPVMGLHGMRHIALEAKFVRAAGGTTCKVWVQTTLDDGETWFDVACFAFATTTANKLHAVRVDPATPMTPATVPASATLTDDTVLDGILGSGLRTLMTTTGTYTGASSIEIWAVTTG